MLNPRAIALAAVFTLAACGSAAAPTPSTPAVTPEVTPTPVPGDPGNGNSGGTLPGGGSDPGSGGGSGEGNTGSGIVIPIPGDPNANPLFGNATYVTPAPGLQNQHPVNVQLVRAVVNNDKSATVDLRWWSGVAPCSQLDSIRLTRDDNAKTIHLTVIEGSGGGQVACIDIAQLTATQVAIATLATGSWTISAQGDAPAITVDVP